VEVGGAVVGVGGRGEGATVFVGGGGKVGVNVGCGVAQFTISRVITISKKSFRMESPSRQTSEVSETSEVWTQVAQKIFSTTIIQHD